MLRLGKRVTSDEQTEKHEGQSSFKKFVELVVRADPCPFDRVAATLADRANVPAYSHRPIIRITAELFESKRMVSGILQKQSKGATRRLFLRGIEFLVRLPKAPSNPGNHIRFK